MTKAVKIAQSLSEINQNSNYKRVAKNQKLAIIGMEAFFGCYDNLDIFERMIYDGSQHFIPVSPQHQQNIETKSSEEQLHIQQTLMGQVIQNAITDAGLAEGENVAIISNTIPCQISTQWNFLGPAVNFSIEENSVFEALEVAQQLLSAKQVDAVVVGVIDLGDGFEKFLSRYKLAPMNTGTNTLSFDENVNGWMVGEGAGSVVLKLYDTAVAKQDKIYAVIDAIALAHHQQKSPDVVKQVCQQAFEQALVKPTDIGYLEVSASGIASEDEAEIIGLIQAYQGNEQASKKQFTCCIGSIKANIGHTCGASGIACLIKTALCLYYRYLSATPQWTKPKMLHLWQESPFYIVTKSKTWFLEELISKRIAAINALELNDTYAHIILSEPSSQKERYSKYLQQTPFYLFPLGADNQSALLEKLSSLQTTLENCDNILLAAESNYSAFQESSQASYKIAIVGHNREELLKEISSALSRINKAFETEGEWKTLLGSYFTAKPLGKQSKIAFVYPGMASTDIEVARDIFRLFPQIYESFSNQVSNISKVLHEKLIYPRSITRLSKEEQAEKLAEFFSDGVAMNLSGVSLAMIYTLIIRDCFEVEPQVAFGYSSGETSSMLFALSVWSEKHHLFAPSVGDAFASSPLLKTELCGSCLAARKFWGLPLTPQPGEEKFWMSYLLKASESEIKDAIENEKKVYLLLINSPKEVIIAGDPPSCLRLIEKVKCRYFPVNVDTVFHTEIAQTEYDRLLELRSIPIQQVPDIEFYSGVEMNPLSLDATSLALNGTKLDCQTVDFPRLVKRVYQDNTKIFIEVGAKNNCSRWISEILGDADYLAVSIHTKGVEDHIGIIKLLAKLIAHGVALNLSPLYEPKCKFF
jgi:PfaB family protein